MPSVTSRLDAPRRALLPLLVLILGASCGALAYVGGIYSHVGLVILAGLITPLPIVIRVFQGRFDVFEPLNIIVIGVLIFFVARPAAELIAHINTYVNNMVPRPGFDGAMLIAIIGTLSIYAGYAAPWGFRWAWRAPKLPSTWDRRRSIKFAIVLLGLAALLTIPLAAALGGLTPLINLYKGRSDTGYQANTAAVGYVLFAPILTIPASLILLVAFLQKRSIPVGLLLFLTILLSLAITVPRGDRTFIVAVVIALVVIYYLKRRRRPRMLSVLAFLLVGVLVINISLQLRNEDTRKQQGVGNTITYALTHVGHEMSQFFTGIDTSEFTVMEIEYQALHNMNNLHLAYHPGATILSMLEGPIPRRVLKHKARAGSEIVDQYLFPVAGIGGQGAGPRGSFAPSPLGDLYADSGWISLVFWSVLIGLVLRLMWEYLRRFPDSEGYQIVYAESLALTVVLMRGSIETVLARAIFLLLPLILCSVLCSRPARERVVQTVRRRTAGVVHGT